MLCLPHLRHGRSPLHLIFRCLHALLETVSKVGLEYWTTYIPGLSNVLSPPLPRRSISFSIALSITVGADGNALIGASFPDTRIVGGGGWIHDERD
jgi:hypothetical protein